MVHDFAYFRAQADRARADADAAVLENVRARALRSVAAFETMAASAKRVNTMRESRKAAADAVAPPPADDTAG